MRTYAPTVISLNLQEEILAGLQAEGGGAVLQVDLLRSRVAWPRPAQRAFDAAEAAVEQAIRAAGREADSIKDRLDDAMFAVRCDVGDVAEHLREALKVEGIPAAAKERVESALALCRDIA